MRAKVFVTAAIISVMLFSLASQTVALASKPKLPFPSHPTHTISFDHYYTYDEMVDTLKAIERRYQRLMRLSIIGESFLGKKIWAVEITNRLRGEPADKSALLVMGQHHGNEVIGKEVVLYFMNYLLTNYGKDPRTTHILDTRTVYVIPLVNPDGNDLTLKQGLYQRENARPIDDDSDGLFSEDPPEDINGDEIITDMRKWNETRGDYDYFYFEGTDNDGDGLINEDWVGGVDLNRNYEYAWEPCPWPGLEFYYGEYPSSEPETQAVRDFVLAHPNIATGLDTHSGGNCVLYPWSYSYDPSPDSCVFDALGSEYAAMTGYSAGQPGALLYTCSGTTMDWAYGTMGIMHFTNEVFGLYYYDAEDPYNETEFFEAYPDAFVSWHTFEHPQLGTVEIGGYNYFRIYNPPENEIEAVCLKNLPMILDLAEATPDIEIENVELEATTSRMYRNVDLSIDLTNAGLLATATEQEMQTGTAEPATVSLCLSPKTQLVKGQPTTRIDMLQGGQTTQLSWTIQVKVPSMNWIVIEARTPRGGVDKIRVTIVALPHKTLMFTKPMNP